jgi:hypothetical protein
MHNMNASSSTDGGALHAGVVGVSKHFVSIL